MQSQEATRFTKQRNIRPYEFDEIKIKGLFCDEDDMEVKSDGAVRGILARSNSWRPPGEMKLWKEKLRIKEREMIIVRVRSDAFTTCYQLFFLIINFLK